MKSLTFGALPPRREFVEYVDKTIDPDDPGEHLFPVVGYRVRFGADQGFADRVARAVNQGIDAALEAVFTRQPGPGVVVIQDPKSMHILLSRMLSHAETLACPNPGRCSGACEYEQAMREVEDILGTLGYGWP